jgi:hypothetical protein
LDTLIANVKGWSLNVAAGISDAGQIGCVGVNPAGLLQGFLLTPTTAP